MVPIHRNKKENEEFAAKSRKVFFPWTFSGSGKKRKALDIFLKIWKEIRHETSLALGIIAEIVPVVFFSPLNHRE